MTTESHPRAEPEAHTEFDCFGDRVAVYAGDLDWRGESPSDAVERSRQSLLAMHATLSRFEPESELSRLNADPRETVPAGTLLLTVAAAVAEAAELSHGLVDATRLDDLERAGYAFTRRGREPIPLRAALRAAPLERRPAQPSAREGWRQISIDVREGTISRPPGLRIDPGGLAKGLAADLVVAGLEAHDTYATDAAGDLRFGGRLGALREISVADPFTAEAIGRFRLRSGGVATSGIGRRSWWTPAGSPAHHLIDPSSGAPAFTGIVQVTALAPTAFEAEVRAKAAVLAGSAGAGDFLPHGGLIVFDDGSHQRLEPS
ncbi:MAG: FAD:protein transferase [Solirubrobacterales bacterium]|nr:FAD:protein transferase [Solirubrobacterales bacterium]